MNEPADSSSPTDKITPAELVDFLQGVASSEVDQRVRTALICKDPEVSSWLQGAAEWARDTLPKSGARPAIRSTEENLDRFFSFLGQHRIDGDLSAESLDRVLQSGRSQEGLFAHRSIAQKEAALRRMAESLAEHEPALAGQWKKRLRGQSR